MLTGRCGVGLRQSGWRMMSGGPVPAPATVDAAEQQPASRYDVAIVGGGHNGLVAAAYLARAGKKVAVFERRPVIGGAAVTEEIVPGFRFSRASYLFSLFRPQIIKELDLVRHGLSWHRKDPTFFSPIGGTDKSLTLGSDMRFNQQQIAQFSERDAKNYPLYEEWVGDICARLERLMDVEPTDLDGSRLHVFRQLSRLYNIMRPLGVRGCLDLYELMTSPISKVMNRWFESDVLKAVLCTDGVTGFSAGPHNVATGYVLLHHVMGGVDGHQGVWAIVHGGMGSVSNAIGQAAVEAGATLFVNAPIEHINSDKRQRARGVRLANGHQVEAGIVLSNCTPQVTFNQLVHHVGRRAAILAFSATQIYKAIPSSFANAISNIDYSSPVTKINVALSGLPNFTALPNGADNRPMPHHQTTLHINNESMDVIQGAYVDYLDGRWSDRPFIEMTIPTSVDPSLVDEPGTHVATLFTQYTPYKLAGGRLWDEPTKREYAEHVFAQIDRYAPGFAASVVGYECLPPPELERIFGLTGGNIFHGAMSLDQLFWARPVTHWANYRTPVRGLYLCGSGSHPGGGVTGSPGRLAAMAVLKDARIKTS